MTLSIGKKIGIGFAIPLVALLAVGIVSSTNLRELEQDASWVTHTVDVKAHLSAFLSAVLHAENYSRGYQLAPAPESRQQFDGATKDADDELRTLRQLTQDNPVQQANLDRLTPETERRLSLSRQGMLSRDALHGRPYLDDQRIQSTVQSGRQAMSAVEALVAAMMGEEDRLLVVRQRRTDAMTRATWDTIVYGTLAALGLVLVTGALVTRSIVGPVRILSEGANRIGSGEYGHRVSVRSRDEVGRLAELFNRMALQVAERQANLAEREWLKAGISRFAAVFQGQRDAAALGERVLAELADVLGARHAVLYSAADSESGPELRLLAAYAAAGAPQRVALRQGLIGQVFAEGRRLVLEPVPDGYLRIRSALGESPPAAVAIVPARFEDRVKAVLELAVWKPLAPAQLDLLDQLASSLGVVLNTIEAGERTEELLRESQKLTENLRSSELELQEQQEELKQTNEELEQTNEEMQQTNEEMEEKVHLLAEQKKELEDANAEIDRARGALEEKARQVAQASKYKSDFLASMSHELRTPLNSMLILSRMLADNGESNLSAKQVQYAQTIYSSGNDLLELINEILDLSKIESGAVVLETQEMTLDALRRFLADSFQPIADSKHLRFELDFAADLPPSLHTDERRLQQVLKNLLSNAFKFTQRGSVRCRVALAPGGGIAFSVIDTGIGIPRAKQELIFEAFQQADAGTARKYGGTGLGLSISRELAWLLGGAITLSSEPGQGSTFALTLPLTAPAKVAPAPALPATPPPTIEPDPEAAADDRSRIEPGDLVLLVIEDDGNFARVIAEFAREKRFKVVMTRSGSRGLALARQIKPSAITLDLKLPDTEGWVILDQLKHDPATRHIPVHVISVEEGVEHSSLARGAVSFLKKPVTRASLDTALSDTIAFLHRPLKRLLVIEDDPTQRQALADLIGGGDVQIVTAGSGHEALAALARERCDCVVLDLGLPDMPGLELIHAIQQQSGAHPPPVIVYTGKELTREEETQLRMVSDSIVVKSARSPERLLDETALFLHRVQAKLPDTARRLMEQAQRNDSVLAGRKVLVVDDDVRNIFAITSALEASRMDVRYAESGQAGIDMLAADPAIEAVLMDVMMPEMDGFEAIRRIRRIDRFKKLPIISVTAKAMKGDREKCLEAGASDYVTKPVDMDQLRSLLRVWLYR